MLHCFAGLAKMVTQNLLVLFLRTALQPRYLASHIDELNSALHSRVSDAPPTVAVTLPTTSPSQSLGKVALSSKRFSVTRNSDQAVASSCIGHRSHHNRSSID
jgi:hypothetical protein